MYALAVRRVLNQTSDALSVVDGQLIWGKMRRLSFEGVIGTVLMDDLADRAPIFAAFYINPTKEQVTKMVSMESRLLPNCDGLRNKSGCFELVPSSP